MGLWRAVQQKYGRRSCYVSRDGRTKHLHRADASLLPVLLVKVDETGRRRVVVDDLARVSQLSQDVLGQDLAQLDTHLIVRVDTPDRTLNVNLVLVERNQRTERLGSQLLEHDRVGRLVTGKDFGLDESIARSLGQFFNHLLFGLAESERFGLSEKVGEQDLVVLAAGNRVERLDGSQKVARNQLGTLVNELVKGVLAVGTGLTPNNRTRLVVDLVTSLGDRLAVRFHVTLLEVVGKLVQVLVVRQQRLSLSAVKVVVPNANKGQDDRQVLLEGLLGKVQIHLVSTEQKLLKVLVADHQADRQADGGPQRVTTTNPVPEGEHVLFRNTECGDGLGVGRKSDKVFGDVLLLARLQEPLLGALGVGDGLLSRECLGSDEEHGRLRVTLLQHLGKVGTIDVGDKVSMQVTLRVRLERFGDHDRTQVTTTDANVDDGVDALAGVPLPFTRANGVGKLLHVVKDALDFIGTCLLDVELVIKDVAQSDVQDGTVFGGVDVFTGKHLATELFNTSLTSEVKKCLEDLIGDQIFREIEENAIFR